MRIPLELENVDFSALLREVERLELGLIERMKKDWWRCEGV